MAQLATALVALGHRTVFALHLKIIEGITTGTLALSFVQSYDETIEINILS